VSLSVSLCAHGHLLTLAPPLPQRRYFILTAESQLLRGKKCWLMPEPFFLFGQNNILKMTQNSATRHQFHSALCSWDTSWL